MSPLRNLRRERRLGLHDAARAMGIGHTTLMYAEKGVGYPMGETLRRIAVYYGLSVAAVERMLPRTRARKGRPAAQPRLSPDALEMLQAAARVAQIAPAVLLERALVAVCEDVIRGRFEERKAS